MVHCAVVGASFDQYLVYNFWYYMESKHTVHTQTGNKTTGGPITKLYTDTNTCRQRISLKYRSEA